MKQVVVFPRGQLTPADRKRLIAAGVVAVEADDPSKVVTVLPSAGVITGDDLMLSFLEAVDGSSWPAVQAHAIAALNRRVNRKESAGKGTP